MRTSFARSLRIILYSSKISESVKVFFFSSRRRHTRFKCDWSSDVCSSDLTVVDRGPLRGDPSARLRNRRVVRHFSRRDAAQLRAAEEGGRDRSRATRAKTRDHRRGTRRRGERKEAVEGKRGGVRGRRRR